MKTLSLSILIFLMPTCGICQVAEAFAKCVGFISYTTGGGKEVHSGTGTLIGKELGNDMSAIFLITNKHVLPTHGQAQYISFRIVDTFSREERYQEVIIPLYTEKGKLYDDIKISRTEDLAAINVSKLIAAGLLHLNRPGLINCNTLADDDTLRKSNVSMGDEVFFIGFPSFIYDSRNYEPIVRTGIIASNPRRDYYFGKDRKFDILHGFLIDANVFGGSSGSLVILRPAYRFFQSGDARAKEPPVSRIYVLGMLSQSYLDIGDPAHDNPKLNLGAVISSKEIIKLINSFLP